MKKKWRLLLILLAVILVLAAGALIYMSVNCLSFSTGRCLVASNGSCLILMDGPVVMSDRTGRGGLFEELRTGDEILILHDGIQETYPGGTGVYFCMRLEAGSMADIPDDLIRDLSPMGWLATDDSGMTREIYTGTVLCYDPVYGDEGNYLLELQAEGAFEESITFTVVSSTDMQTLDSIAPGDRIRLECTGEGSGYKEVTSILEFQTVSYAWGDADMRLELPAGWDYEIHEYSESSYTFGISFWPGDSTEGKIRLEYYPDGFGVCGTGLEEERIWLNGQSGYKGTYDGREIWSFISTGNYAFLTENVGSWWETYEAEAMEIITTAILSE